MLVQLVIRNFAIIDDLTIEFGPGLNALTGETGAGKSILIDALGAVLGERTTADVVRTGAQRATIDAEFRIDDSASSAIPAILEEHGIELSDEQLLITREIQTSGRSSARINGRPVTVALLSMIGDALVDIHGQSDHLSLLKKSRQREILDTYGVGPELLANMSKLVRDWRAVRASLENVTRNARETAQRIDLLTYQIDEIDAAALAPGEDALLDQEFARLSQFDRLASEISLALGSIDPEDQVDRGASPGALSELRSADKAVSDAAAVDHSLNDLGTRLRDVLFLLDDVVLELRRYQNQLEANPARLEAAGDRIARISDLKRKYGASINDVLTYRHGVATELASLAGSGFDGDALREQVASLFQQVIELGKELSAARQQAAARMTVTAQEIMGDLQLGGASFSVEVRRRLSADGDNESLDPGAFDESGFDDVEFQFAPNAGEIPRPLARIASGGEMARVMLALKAVLATADSIPTYVFDEVDVGVGGRSGSKVGENLRTLAEHRQVLVISHLPQVAGYASRHFRIRKEVRNGRTFSVVEPLDDAGRVEELAAMLDGEPVTDASRAKAIEMMNRIGVEAGTMR